MRDLLSIGTSRGCEMIGTGLGLGLAGYRINPAGMMLPVLDINFRDFKSFSSTIGPTASFSRASSGTYFDETGVLRTASTNVGRINHVYNGSTWVCKGGLIEAQRTNIAQYTEDFSNVYWTKSGISVAANNTAAPDGNTTADKIVENSSSGIKYGTISGGFSVTSGVSYCFSVFAKGAGRYLGFATNSTAFPNAIGAVFNLSNGTISNIQANTTAAIQDVGNGWYRCSITGSANATTTTNINFGVSNDLNQIYPSYTGNGSSGYFLWGFQIEAEASFASSYIPCLSNSSTTRSADLMQITGSNFSGFYNSTQGSFTVEYERNGYASGSYPPVFYAYDSALPGGRVIGVTGNNNAGGGESFWVADTSFQAQIVAGSMLATGATGKVAACYKANDFAASLNGAAIVSDTSGTLPTVNSLNIGSNGAGDAFTNGHIARLRYWNTRLDNATLRALST